MIAKNLLKMKDTLSSAKDKFSSAAGTGGNLTSAFQKASETANKVKSASSSTSLLSSVTDSINSTLDKFTNTISNTANGVAGLFSKVACGGSGSSAISSITSKISGFSNLSASLKMDKYKSLLNIGKANKITFNTNINVTVCGKTKSLNPLDAISSVSNFIKKNPSILSSPKETLLRALVKDELVTKLGLGQLGKVIQKCIVDKVLEYLNTNDYGSGPTLRSKNTLNSLLNQDACLSSIAKLPLVSKYLSNASTVALINVLINKDKNTTQDLIEALLTVTGQRDTALGGLASAIAYAKDYNTRAKMKLLYSVFKNKSNNITYKDYLCVKTSSSKVLEKLDEEKEKSNTQTNDPVNDFKEITDTLDIVDPSWRADNNYSNVSCNKSLADLATRTLNANSTTPDFSTGVFKTELKQEHYIAIINKFHSADDENCKNINISTEINNAISNLMANRLQMSVATIPTTTKSNTICGKYSTGKITSNNYTSVSRTIVNTGCGCN